MMYDDSNTYIFVERDGNATITLSADNEEEAWDYLLEVVKDLRRWRLDDVRTQED